MLPECLQGFSCSGPALASCTWQSLTRCTSFSKLQCKVHVTPLIRPESLVLDLVQLEENCIGPEPSAAVEWCISVARNADIAKLMLADCAPLLLPKFHGLRLDSLCFLIRRTSALLLQQAAESDHQTSCPSSTSGMGTSSCLPQWSPWR